MGDWLCGWMDEIGMGWVNIHSVLKINFLKIKTPQAIEGPKIPSRPEERLVPSILK